MDNMEELNKKVEELGARKWDAEAIEARVRKFTSDGIPQKKLEKEYLIAHKEEILDSVQKKAEEYNYITKNCSQGTALALLDEFGMGSMEVIKGLMLYPGIGGTGDMCGGITGSLVAFGLYFFGDDPLDLSKVGDLMFLAQDFMAFFEGEIGFYYCAEIQEKIIFGKNMDPGSSEDNMGAFAAAKGFEKCGLPPGIGARLAAGFMIDNFDMRS